MAAALILMAALAVGEPTSDCLWRAAGPSQQHAWLSDYDRKPEAVMALKAPADAAMACNVTEERARNLLVARVMETGAESWWDRDMQNPGALAKSWEALNEGQRVKLRRWAVSAIKDGNGDEVDIDPLPAFGKGAGLAKGEGPGMMQLMSYMLGRGYREAVAE